MPRHHPTTSLRPARTGLVAALVLILAIAGAAAPAWSAPADLGGAHDVRPVVGAPARAGAVLVTPGPGSYLTVVDHGPSAGLGGVDARRQRLVLISPSGAQTTLLRHRVTTPYAQLDVADWSPDGRTVLLTTGHKHGSVATELDLTTGATRSLRLGEDVDAVLLDPDGSGVVATAFDASGSSPFVLEKISWAGAVTAFPDRTTGSMLLGPDHTVVTHGAHGARVLRVVSLDDGHVVHSFHTGAACTPVRWWDATRILATCGLDLSLVDTATGARTDLTTRHGVGDDGHVDGRRVSSGLYVQVSGACGTTFVSHRARDGSMHRLQVPGAVGNVVMVDGVGRDLVIEHADDCGGARPRAVLSRYDPVTRRERPLVELGPHEEFRRIRVEGETSAVSY